ncbi:acyltransferase family protein [Arcticibacter eurypsychrophilus]|uniref:acyltransferase family protein n=1 Tax=Arcticibacter eurypsychrophilus TaxID=1434752 RepID=UPI00084D68AB|nr:acyltransferase [Arcticibacter eurypsychrophilus]
MTRLKELDVLRGFAALNVVLFHYTSRFREIYGHNYPVKYDWIYGHYGVELFFVISGFVIYMTLQKVNNVKEFAFKRFTRLYPTYWICLLITLSIISLWKQPGKEGFTVYEIIMNLSMIQGVFEVRNIDGAYWSLLPELFFYTAMAFIYYLGWLPKVKVLALTWLLLMLLNRQGLFPFGAYFLNFKYGMFFLAGILFYNLKFNNGGFTDHLLIAACLGTGIWIHQSAGCIYAFTGIFFLFYLFVYNKLKVLNIRPLVFLGYVSYPLYLLHQNIGFILMKTLKLYISNEFVVIFLCVVILIGIAWLVARYLEKPILYFLRNLQYSRKQYPDKVVESLIQ